MTSANPHEAVIANWPINKDRYAAIAQWFVQDAGSQTWFLTDSEVKDDLRRIGYDQTKRQTMTLAERYTIAAGLLALAAEHVGKTPFERWLMNAYPVAGLDARERELMEHAWEASRNG